MLRTILATVLCRFQNTVTSLYTLTYTEIDNTSKFIKLNEIHNNIANLLRSTHTFNKKFKQEDEQSVKKRETERHLKSFAPHD